MLSAYYWQKHFFILLFLLSAFFAAAQTADFTATPTAGCSPLSVNFKNTSTGFSAAATYSWDLGNGNSASTKDAGANYKDEHDYTIILTVTDGGKPYTKSETVTVYKKPTVDFTFSSNKGCVPLPVTFTSNSTPGDGTISSYFWDYGDGIAEPGAAQQQHIYTTPTDVSASLTVTNSYHCYSTASKANIIKVLPPVTASFAAAQTVLCKATDAAVFTNTSTGAGTLSYAWNFGDGNTSTAATPSYVYGKKGTYTVTLKVTSSDGCTDDSTQTGYINVANFSTDFDEPPLICENTSTTFTDKSNPQPNPNSPQQWIINNQSYYSYNNQFTNSFSPGTYTIKLVNGFGKCNDTATKNFTVFANPITAGFTAGLQNACGAPATVNFKDTTQGAVKWEWDFDNTYYNDFVPTVFTQAPSYTYNSEGTYYVWLRTTNAAGCTSSVNSAIDIRKPNVGINSSAGIYGCDSLHTIFSATSTQVIKQTTWNFGDGSATTTDSTPKHTFTKPGDYTITLDYVTANGCKGTTTFHVYVTGTPSFTFTASPDSTICGNNLVTFNISGSNTIGYKYWNFGDPDNYYYSTENTHQYYKDSVYTVSLIITNQGCADTVTKTNYIKVLPPFPHIDSILNTCDGLRGLVTFKEASVKANEWSWDFGDKSSPYTYTSKPANITHNYISTGSYKITLTTKNGSCTVRDSSTAYVLLKQNPLLSSPQTEVCGSATLPVTVSNLETNPARTYIYTNDFNINSAEYGDGSTFLGNYNSPDYYYWRDSFHLNIYNLDNTKTNFRIITNSTYFNCLDTTNYIPIKVKGPDAGFTIINNDTCFKVPLTFSDTSKGSNGVPIVKWDWYFGDNNSASKITGNNFDYQYKSPGYYSASLTVTDRDGCTATAQNYDVITKGPQAAFTISQNPALPGIDDYFYNNSSTTGTDYNDNKFKWLLGDGTEINSNYYNDNPVHSYANTGIDTVMLIAKNEVTRCIDTAVQYLYIKNINLSYTYTTSFLDPVKSCPPMLAKFTNTSVNTQSVTWDFGDGGTSSNPTIASHIYDKPGKYKVTLYGYFYDNTIDSVFDYITIQGPYATLAADKTFACGAQPVTLSALAANTTSFTWDFGDGTLTNATDTFAVHNYLTPGMYTPSLIVNDANKCSFPFFLDKPIIIDTLHLNINKKPAIVCDASNVLFTPDIVSVARDDAGAILTYHWNFGTGDANDTANTESANFMYNKTGTYPVVFSASSPYGCAEETEADIIVNPTPVASIKGPASVCQDDYGIFTGSSNVNNSGVTWEWHFPNNNAATTQTPEQQLFPMPITDSVKLLVSDGGCTDTVFSKIIIYAKPQISIEPAMPQVCAGQSVQLVAHDGISYKWLPNSSIDNAAIANPNVSPAFNTMYKVNVTNSNGCMNTDSVTVRVTQRFKITASPLLYLCKGGTKQLNVSGADKYEWLNGNNLSDIHSANPVSSATAPQTYTVVGYDKDHCFTDTAATEIRIDELPTIKAGEDTVVFAGSQITLNTVSSPDVTIWTWLPADYLNCYYCAAPMSKPQSNILYIVEAATAHGCTSKDSIQISVLCKQSLVQIPSAFTPNGDAKNDVFNILGQGIKQISRFIIFNRTGEVLFQKANLSANDANAGWDGTNNGQPMPSGTYVYMADIVCSTGEVFHYKGTVTLIR